MRFRPDVVLSSNTPLFAQRRIGRWASASNVGFVFWVQDVISIAMRKGANRRVPGLGSAIGRVLTAVERDAIAKSDRIVVISDDFVRVIEGWNIEADKVEVVENWAPLAELPQLPKANAWAQRHGLDAKRVLLYSGTLGMKHNPALLVDLAEAYRHRPDVVLVIVSEGLGADWVAREVERRGLPNILQLPYQPYEALPEVLAAADVLLAILEPDAGAFSVPSKVLSYHCAGRPIVAAVPARNLAARVVTREGSGVVVDPAEPGSLASAVSRLLDDGEHARHVGQRARAYAERAFDITSIATRFERVLTAARRNSSITV
jgi:glycosyltransferase involved in cell wall biosynthesis